MATRSLLVLPDDSPAEILAAIGGAKKSLRVKMFVFSDPRLIAAVIGAKKRGVDVRIMLNAGRRDGDDDNAQSRKELRKAERRRYDVRGLLAAYVADEYRLGAAATARRELDRQLRAHRITRAFRSLLLRRLKAWGYR